MVSRPLAAGALILGSMTAVALPVDLPIATPETLSAQEPDLGRATGTAAEPMVLLRVTLTNGVTYFGQAVEPSNGNRSPRAETSGSPRPAAAPRTTPLHLQLPDGQVVELAPEMIAREDVVHGRFREGEFWHSDTNASRLFFGATGRSLPAGAVTFNAYYGLIPFLGIGLTDRLSIAGGTPLFFSEHDDGRLFYLAPKFQFVRTSRVEASTGILAFFETGSFGESSYLGFVVATLGRSSDDGVTLGLGWGRDSDGWSSSPTVMVGADHRIERRIKLVTENYWFGGDEPWGMASLGIRVVGERLSADLALGAPFAGNENFLLPLVNFSVGW